DGLPGHAELPGNRRLRMPLSAQALDMFDPAQIRLPSLNHNARARGEKAHVPEGRIRLTTSISPAASNTPVSSCTDIVRRRSRVVKIQSVLIIGRSFTLAAVVGSA